MIFHTCVEMSSLGFSSGELNLVCWVFEEKVPPELLSVTWKGSMQTEYRRHLLDNFFKASLNITILKLYTIGLTIEFARWRTFTSDTAIGLRHGGQQKSLAVYKMVAGNQNTSDTAITTKTVLDSRKLRSALWRAWISIERAHYLFIYLIDVYI